MTMSTAQGTLDLCRLLGVRLTPNGRGGFVAFGTAEAKAKVKELVLEHRIEILQLLAAEPDGCCSDCGRASVVVVATDYAKFCRACLRPSPTNARPRMKGLS